MPARALFTFRVTHDSVSLGSYLTANQNLTKLTASFVWWSHKEGVRCGWVGGWVTIICTSVLPKKACNVLSN